MRAQPFEQVVGTRLLQGTLSGIRAHGGREGPLRIALRPEGRHGGHALRHGLDWLLASLHDLPLYEVFSTRQGADPRLVVREPMKDKAQVVASLLALLALREGALRVPLPFLPKSGFVYAQALREALDGAAGGTDIDALRAAAMDKARDEWCGDEERRRAEAGPDTQLALRGRDPFVDADADSRRRFQRIAEELFGAFSQERAFDAERLR